MKKFKLKGAYMEATNRAFKKAAIWAFITGMALAKAVKAWEKYNVMYGIAVTAQLADEAGVVEEVMKESEKYHR